MYAHFDTAQAFYISHVCHKFVLENEKVKDLEIHILGIREQNPLKSKVLELFFIFDVFETLLPY